MTMTSNGDAPPPNNNRPTNTKVKKQLPPPPRYDSGLKFQKLKQNEGKPPPTQEPGKAASMTFPPPPPPPLAVAMERNDSGGNPVVLKSGNDGVVDYDDGAKPRITTANRRGAPPLLASRQRTIPVLTVSTLTANSDLCEAKNGVSLSHLFTAVGGEVRGLNTSFRSITRSFLVNEVDLRFINSSACKNPYYENEEVIGDDKAGMVSIVDRCLSEAVRSLTIDDGHILESEIDECVLNEVQQDLQKRDADISSHDLSSKYGEEALRNNAQEGKQFLATPDLPWFRRLRALLDYSTDHMSHEMISCPIIVLLVASSSDEDFINCFRDLMVDHHLPRQYHTG